MCFSATASFASAAIVGVAGIASIKNAERKEEKYFASIPLIFAMQQLVEGFVWLSFNSEIVPDWQSFSIKAFLFFATVVWPLIVPLTVWKMEESSIRRKLLFGIFIAGIIFSLGSLSFMFIYPSNATISEKHVYYQLYYPLRDSLVVSILYLGTTVFSLLLSTRKWVPVLGVLIFASYLVSRFYFEDHVISVWCFFAAIMSVIIYLVMSGRLKGFKTEKQV